MLTNKTAVITGAARGIGREIALRFAREGAFVMLIDLAGVGEAVESLTRQGLQGIGLEVDIRDSLAVERAAKEIFSLRGSVDILVNNAGIIARGSILELTTEQWLKVIDVNVNGTFHCCKAFIPSMIERR